MVPSLWLGTISVDPRATGGSRTHPICGPDNASLIRKKGPARPVNVKRSKSHQLIGRIGDPQIEDIARPSDALVPANRVEGSGANYLELTESARSRVKRKLCGVHLTNASSSFDSASLCG